jgi:hypothetical protein
LMVIRFRPTPSSDSIHSKTLINLFSHYCSWLTEKYKNIP